MQPKKIIFERLWTDVLTASSEVIKRNCKLSMYWIVAKDLRSRFQLGLEPLRAIKQMIDEL